MTKIVEINKNITDFLNDAYRMQGELDQSTKYTGHVGYVYLLKINEKIYKLGMTKNLGFRLEQLLGNKIRKGIKDFTVLFLIETNAPNQLEVYLRQVFERQKVKGQKDHFYLKTEDVEYIRVIAYEKKFKNEYPKPEKILARPGSIEDFLNKIFKRKYDLIAVANTLAGHRGEPLTIAEINEIMAPIKYDDEDIANAIKRLRLQYNFIDSHGERVELNKYFWDEFAKREYIKNYRMAVIMERKNSSCYGMGINIK